MQDGYFHQWFDKKYCPTHLSSRWSELIDVYIYVCINLQLP